MTDEQRPLGHNVGLPDWENDRALRFTFVVGFEDHENVSHLEAIADLMLSAAREGGSWGGTTDAEDVEAAAHDVVSIATYLLMLAESVNPDEDDDEDLRLAEAAPVWAARLQALAREMTAEAGRAETVPDRVAVAVEALEDGQRHLLAALNAEPQGPLAGPLGGALGRAAEALALLRRAIGEEIANAE